MHHEMINEPNKTNLELIQMLELAAKSLDKLIFIPFVQES